MITVVDAIVLVKGQWELDDEMIENALIMHCSEKTDVLVKRPDRILEISLL